MLTGISATSRCFQHIGGKYELSSGDEWEGSDPAAMNKWIETQVAAKSPETSGSYQLRRIIRMGKFYSKTHASRLNVSVRCAPPNGADFDGLEPRIEFLNQRDSHKA